MLRQFLSANVGEIEIVDRLDRPPHSRRVQDTFAPQEPDRLGEMLDRQHLDPTDERRFVRVGAREQDRALAGVRGGHGARERPADTPDAPVERKLPEQAQLAQPLLRDATARGEHSKGDRKIEAGSRLPQVGRRKVDGDALQRPLLRARRDGRADALARFLDRRVRQPDDVERRQALRDRDFHLHRIAVQADDGDALRPGDRHG